MDGVENVAVSDVVAPAVVADVEAPVAVLPPDVVVVPTVEVPAKKKRKRRKVVAKKKDGRGGAREGAGAPPRFHGKQLKHVVSLIRKHGLTETRAILAASNRSALSNERNKEIFPSAESVSMPTLGTIAANAGITLHRGRKAA